MAEKEIKFVFAPRFGPLLAGWLDASCVPSATYPCNVVTSIYYDDPAMTSLGQKRDSELLKRKFRVRWYEDPATGEVGDAFAELKDKDGSLRGKRRVRLDVAPRLLDDPSLTSPALLGLPHRARRLGLPVDPAFRPTLRVEYERHRYTHVASGAQVNLDRHIRPVGASPAVLRGVHARHLPVLVLEAKGAASRLPAAMAGLTRLGGRRRAFSKYLECHRSAAAWGAAREAT